MRLNTLFNRVYIIIMTREFIITKEFDRNWKELGLSDDDLRESEIYLCKNPDCIGARWQKIKYLKAL